MNAGDLKIWGLSSLAITVNLMDIDQVLSVALSLFAIGYTLHKWYILYKSNQKKSNGS